MAARFKSDYQFPCRWTHDDFNCDTIEEPKPFVPVFVIANPVFVIANYVRAIVHVIQDVIDTFRNPCAEPSRQGVIPEHKSN